MKKQLGARIKELREKFGMTQAELAGKLSYTPQTVSNWESESREPDVKALVELSSIFNVSLDYLISGKEQEDKIGLDDMDDKKRLAHILKNDDAKNFEKYKYKERFFTKDLRSYAGIRTFQIPKKELWLQVLESKAHKVFDILCKYIIQLNTQKIMSAGWVCYFLDDFVKMAVDNDDAKILDNIGFRFFAVKDTKELKESKPIAWVRAYPICEPEVTISYINSPSRTFLIDESTLEYIFKRRKESPKCYEYATTLQPTVEIRDTYGPETIRYALTYLENHLIDLCIKYGYIDTLGKILSDYERAFKDSEEKFDNHDFAECFYQKSYLISSWGDNYYIKGRLYYFRLDEINSLIKSGKFEYARKLNSFNQKIIKSRNICSLVRNREAIKAYNDSEIERQIKLNSDLSEEERAYATCIDDYILVPSEIKKLHDLKLVRKIINAAYYNYYEFAFEMIRQRNIKALLKFLVDHNLDRLAKMLLRGKDSYSDFLVEVWNYFDCADNQKKKHPDGKTLECEDSIINKQNPLKFPADPTWRFVDGIPTALADLAAKLEGNKLIEIIKQKKDELYDEASKLRVIEQQEQKKKLDRAKETKGLTKEYFEDLLSKKGLFAKRSERLFVLDLCSLFDAILKYDYGCEGEDLFSRMDAYFKLLKSKAPKSRDTDDGWGYMVPDYEYERNTVIPEQNRIKHLEDLFNRLRMERNNIAHSETTKVKGLSKDELNECLDYVFSINKGN